MAARPTIPRFRRDLLKALRKGWADRPADLKRLDLQRDLEPDWFQRPDMAGYVFYIDRFAGNLRGVLDKLDYLEDLGITYVHLMPCLKPRPGDSDGGYSVMDYRAINPAYGTMADFEAVGAGAARARHEPLHRPCAEPHRQGTRLGEEGARKGDPTYQDYYLMFDDDRPAEAV